VLFAVLVTLSAAAMLIRRAPAAQQTGNARLAGWMALVGVPVGVFTGLVGAGGGFVVVPTLTVLGGLSLRRAVATSLLIILLNSGAALAGYSGHTAVDQGAALFVTGFAVLGALVGTWGSDRIPGHWIRFGFGALVLNMGCGMLAHEFGADPVMAIVPAMLLSLILAAKVDRHEDPLPAEPAEVRGEP